MDKINSSIWEIPTIWSSQNLLNQAQWTAKKPDVAMFDNAPCDVTAWSFFWKIVIWVIVWICVAALLFASLSAVGWLTDSENNSVNSMLWIILPVIWFIVWFVWNLTLAGLYNVFFSNKYYNFWKMFGLIFASSLIIFIFFLPPYFLYKDIHSLYTLMWFQIILELFISKNLIDFMSQPNYSASSLMWNTLWAVLAVVLHLLIISLSDTDINHFLLYIIASAIVTYIIVVIWSWVWDAIYYKFYEWWNNPFYLPSLNELREERRKEEVKKKLEEEEINIDVK